MSDGEKIMPPANRKVDHHDVALEVYIDALLIEDDLFDQPEAAAVTEVEVAPKTVPVAFSSQPIKSLPASEPETGTPSLTEVALRQTIEQALLRQEQQVAKHSQPIVDVAPEATAVTVAAPPEPVVELKPDVTESQLPTQPLVPDWAENDCEALIFKVGGFLTLATPLVELSTILTWREDALTPMPGRSEWFLGLLKVRNRQVKVIDIAKFVIPKNHKARAGLEKTSRFKHIIIVGDGEFGLACDELGEVIKVLTDGVRWRTDRSSRPWLAGTVVEQMCALLDMDVFCQMLKDGLTADEIRQ